MKWFSDPNSKFKTQQRIARRALRHRNAQEKTRRRLDARYR